jgi:hypothetical protein
MQSFKQMREGGELAYFEYAGVRTMKGPLVGPSGRKQLKGIAKVGESLRRKHKGKRELVLGNLPPAVATHLRKSKDAAAQRPARTKKKSRAKSRA